MTKEDIVFALVVVIALVLVVVGVLPLLLPQPSSPTPPSSTVPPGTSVTYTSYTFVGVVVLVLVPAMWWYMERKRDQGQTGLEQKPLPSQPTVPPTVYPPAGVMHCVYCGAAIPSIVQFCTKCGRKQRVSVVQGANEKPRKTHGKKH